MAFTFQIKRLPASSESNPAVDSSADYVEADLLTRGKEPHVWQRFRHRCVNKISLVKIKDFAFVLNQ